MHTTLFRSVSLLAFALTATSVSRAANDVPIKDSIFLIGNSLTIDTRPDRLDGTVAYDTQSGRNLSEIYSGSFLSSSFVGTNPWSDVMSTRTFDWVSVQPYPGTTLDQDVTTISRWMQMQPDAAFVIHTGWNKFADHERDYHAKPAGKMMYASLYFKRLIAELRSQYPNRKIVSTQALDVLDSIYHDIQDDRAPFRSLSDLYRDDLHMTTSQGQYLMHNLMRRALGQPMSDAGFGAIDPKVKAYLDRKVKTVPEPSTNVIAMVGFLLTLVAHRRRRCQGSIRRGIRSRRNQGAQNRGAQTAR